VRYPFVSVVVVVAFAACSGKPAVPPAPASPNAITWASCGPTDGAAQTFVLQDGDAVLSCADQPTFGTRAHYVVELWSGAPLVDAPLALRGTTGRAQKCSAAGACQDLENATLTFHGDANRTTVGTVRFVDAGVEVVRTFRAAHCDVRVMCG
jgi:hypothetical protein